MGMPRRMSDPVAEITSPPKSIHKVILIYQTIIGVLTFLQNKAKLSFYQDYIIAPYSCFLNE